MDRNNHYRKAVERAWTYRTLYRDARDEIPLYRAKIVELERRIADLEEETNSFIRYLRGK